MKDKKLSLNLFSSILSFSISLGVNFFLTPYIIDSIGVEANGFVALSNNFINYVSLLTIALNSMAGRFITIEIHKNNYDKANVYFNSVILVNVVFTILLLLPLAFFVLNIDNILDIPTYLVCDIKLLMTFLCFNFLLGLSTSTWGVSMFATNNLYMQSLIGIIANFLRVLCLITLFSFFSPSIYFIGLTATITTVFQTGMILPKCKKLLPEIKLNFSYFQLKVVLELISSGIWNTITKLGHIFIDGLDLLIANLFIGPTEMGLLALAKTVPNMVQSLIANIVTIFMPEFTRAYALKDINLLISFLKKSIKILGLLTSIPIGILIVFGLDFFKLWVPNQDTEKLFILSLLTVFPLIISGSINTIFNIFTVTNKLKVNSISLIISGLISTIIVFILLKTTNLGIYAIAGVSSLVLVIKNTVLILPYAARCLNKKWHIFYKELLIGVFSIMTIIITALLSKLIFQINSWIDFFLLVFIVAVVGSSLNFFIILSKDERKYLKSLIIKKK